VAVPGLSDRIHRKLLALLAEDRPEPGGLEAGLRQIATEDEVPVFSEAMRLLAGLQLPDEIAEKLLSDVLAHRDRLGRALNRDPGVRVAAADFLHNVQQRLTDPMIIERSQFEETERSAVTDPLTGLYNRRFFTSTFQREVRRGRRYGMMLSLIMLDLDDFKRVNDEYGHLFGDLVLKRAAKIVRRAIRESDTACRYGGEEFAVILPETDRLGAFAVAERVRRRTARAFSEGPTAGRSVVMTVSGGVASYPEDGARLDDLVHRADESLYRAKALGKNRIALHHAERRREVRYPARTTARIELGPIRGSESRPARALNLSRHGALVATTSPLRLTEPVRVVLTAGRHGAVSQRWLIHGRVVRVQPCPPQGHHVGIAFDQPLPEPCLRAQARYEGAVRPAVGGRR
jgi:diguanylate cyclase (GGDEF)-like protein